MMAEALLWLWVRYQPLWGLQQSYSARAQRAGRLYRAVADLSPFNSGLNGIALTAVQYLLRTFNISVMFWSPCGGREFSFVTVSFHVVLLADILAHIDFCRL